MRKCLRLPVRPFIINNQQFFDANPEAARQVKPDGTAYAEGEIVPFHIRRLYSNHTWGFMNIPSGAVEFSLHDALEGIPRYRTEYIDRGRGLF